MFTPCGVLVAKFWPMKSTASKVTLFSTHDVGACFIGSIAQTDQSQNLVARVKSASSFSCSDRWQTVGTLPTHPQNAFCWGIPSRQVKTAVYLVLRPLSIG